MKSLLMLVLAASLATACSQSNPQSAATGQEATDTTGSPAASAAPAAAAAPAESAPAAQAPAANAAAQPATSAPAEAPRPAAAPPASPAPAAPAPAQAASAPPPAPPPPPAPKFREITIPAGTALEITMLSTLGSATSKVEDPVRASLAKPVLVSGTTVLPTGAELSGNVTDVKESGRVKGRAAIAFRFNSLKARGETYRIQTADVSTEAEANRGSDVKKGGVGAGLGAVVGGVIGGGKGAAIGAVAGGTGAVLGTKGGELQIAPGTAATALLQEALTVTVPVK